MIFTTRSRTGLGIGLLLVGLLLTDAGDHGLMLVIAGIAVMALGAVQIVSAFTHRDGTNQPDDPFASPPDESV